MTGTSLGSDLEHNTHKTCFEKHWKENKDFFKVENPIVCHDGESIQVIIGICFSTTISRFNLVIAVEKNSQNNYLGNPD